MSEAHSVDHESILSGAAMFFRCVVEGAIYLENVWETGNSRILRLRFAKTAKLRSGRLTLS